MAHKADPADVRRLLAALRPEAKGAEARGLGDPTDADWKSFLLLARKSLLEPLLSYRSERSGSLAAAPERVRAELHRGYCANAMRNTRFFNSLAIVLRALTKAGVEVIPLKGIHLAELVYESRALRRIGDADLLVKAEDMAAAEGAMRALGYTQKRAASFEAAQEVSQHVPPYGKDGSVDVELHWNIGNPTIGVAADERGLWARSGRALIGGVDVRVLSPADLLFHLCMHMSVLHKFRGHLRALFDISETLARHGGAVDWDVFRRGCSNPGIDKGCRLALTLAAKHAGAAVPEEILRGSGPAGDGNGDDAAALKTAEDLLLCERDSAIGPMVARLWGAYSLGEKVRHFFRRIFLTRSEMECAYPVKGSSPMIYFFYAWRAVDLLSRRGGGAWRLFRRGTTMTEDADDDIKENALRDWMNRRP
jgi:hypothetical protein